MTIKIDVKSNIKQFTKGLNKLGRSQIPFATNKTIANTAFRLMTVTKETMGKYVDRPTKLTKSSVRYEAPKNKKALPIGYVYFSELVSKYLKYSIYGGMRPFKKGRVLPTRNISTNAFGNIRNHRNIISTLKNKKDHFINSTGIFKRYKNGTNKLLYLFETRAVKYKKTFPFFERMNLIAPKVFDHHFKKNLQKAIDNTKELIAKGVLR